MSEDSALPWFRIQLKDGRSIEIHSTDAIKIYERDFKELVVTNTTPAPVQTVDDASATAEVTEFPSTIPKPSGTEDAVIKILDTDWGKVSLKSPADIRAALEHCGYQFSSGAIFGAVKHLFDKTKVRRQKLGKGYVYGLPLSAV